MFPPNIRKPVSTQGCPPEPVLPGGKWEVKGEVAQTMYTHVSKCKNNKNKRRKSKFM
jgi:hypothetical protein